LVPVFASTALFDRASGVDLFQWVQELRVRDPRTYGDLQENYATAERENRAKQITLDAVTAALLLKDDTMDSAAGRTVLLQFQRLFVYNDPANCLQSCVRELVPSLQAMFNASLSPSNRQAIVEAVMQLPFKVGASATWVKAELKAVNGKFRVVADRNCEQVLVALGQAKPPSRAQRQPPQARVVEVSQAKVCIAGFVSEHGRGFSCAQKKNAATPSSDSSSGDSSESSSDSSDDDDTSSDEGPPTKVSGSMYRIKDIVCFFVRMQLQKKAKAPQKVIRSFRSTINCTLSF